MTDLSIPVAPVFRPLLAPARYKAIYSGRGGGKSWFFASLLLAKAAAKPGFRAICLREVQTTLRDSSKRLIEDRMASLDLGAERGFEIYHDRIATPGGGVITFAGLQKPGNILSLEGIDVSWVDEAQSISERSLTLLRPTIRVEKSECWFAWNPRMKSDPVDRLFRGPEIPTDAVVVASGWRQNPWWKAELDQERLDDIRINPETAGHIWEGEYVSAISGAYYSKELLAARTENRVTRLAADPLMTYRVFVDIGGTGRSSDACAMWVMQFIGREIRALDYYEAQGQPLSEHINWLGDAGYTASRSHIHLPHDGITQDRVFSVSFDSEFRRAGYRTSVTKNQGAGASRQRIAAVRKIFPSVLFNSERCAAGLDALGWYHERRDEHRSVGLGPDHDWSSHCCDAFGLMALEAETLMQSGRVRPAVEKRRVAKTSNAWMS